MGELKFHRAACIPGTAETGTGARLRTAPRSAALHHAGIAAALVQSRSPPRCLSPDLAGRFWVMLGALNMGIH